MTPVSHASGAPAAPPKEILTRLARNASGGLIRVARAAEVLGQPRRITALRLARLARQGWLKRIRRGLYLVLPLESAAGGAVAVEDPWILAVELFSPCYIGGWSAVEHWGLSEQIFRSTFVVTAKHVRTRDMSLASAELRVAQVPLERLRGTTMVWRGRVRVAVSDRERTLVDALNNPAWVGGVRHLADIFRNYIESRERDGVKLMRRLNEGARGAGMKRLGYLAENLWPNAGDVIELALSMRSTGIIKLDPSARARGRLNKRWGLWINVSVER